MSIDEHRAHLTEMLAIGVDDQGREVLVGLTFEEAAVFRLPETAPKRTSSSETRSGQAALAAA